MNPYTFVRNDLFPSVPTGVEFAGLWCLLTKYAAAYSSGFTRAIGNNEADYVVGQLIADFGGDNAAVLKLRQMLAGKLGR